jgi:6-phosphogluconolactonase (cycloisomerase 2 family)
MRMKSSGWTLSAVALLVMAFLTACGGSGTPKVRSISVTPATATITKSLTPASSDTLQFKATALLSDGTMPDETNTVTWSSSNTGVATISATGLATAVAHGTTTITAALTGGFTATATLSVSQVASVAVTPPSPTIGKNTTQQFVATATITKADGTTATMDVSSDPGTAWSSGTTTVATINTTGLASGIAGGTSLISAIFGGATGSTTLTVLSAGPVSLVLTPLAPTIAVSNSVAFAVKEKWSDLTLHDPAGPVAFISGTTTTATINATTGVALAVGVGTSTITANEGTTLTGTATLTVAAANARYAYVANNGEANIGEYSVNVATGKFTALIPPTIPAIGIQQVIVDPNGLYVYCLCAGGATTQTFANLYNVTPGTGVLTAPTTAISTVVGTGGFNRAVIDPTGQFMFVIDGNTAVVQSFAISQKDGSLTAVNSVTTGPAATAAPVDVLIDHTGKYLYVVNNGANTVSQYTVAADGTLAAQSPATVATGIGPLFSTIDPVNKYLYVPNNTDNTLSIFSIDSTTGLLTLQSTPAITGATAVANVAVDPTNKHIYVLDSTASTTGHLYGYNTGTGALGTALAGSPFALAGSGDGLGPIGIAIDPTGALVAVDNNLSGNISLLQDVPSTGILTPSAFSPVTSGSGTSNTGTEFVVFYIAP